MRWWRLDKTICLMPTEEIKTTITELPPDTLVISNRSTFLLWSILRWWKTTHCTDREIQMAEIRTANGSREGNSQVIPCSELTKRSRESTAVAEDRLHVGWFCHQLSSYFRQRCKESSGHSWTDSVFRVKCVLQWLPDSDPKHRAPNTTAPLVPSPTSLWNECTWQ